MMVIRVLARFESWQVWAPCRGCSRNSLGGTASSWHFPSAVQPACSQHTIRYATWRRPACGFKFELHGPLQIKNVAAKKGQVGLLHVSIHGVGGDVLRAEWRERADWPQNHVQSAPELSPRRNPSRFRAPDPGNLGLSAKCERQGSAARDDESMKTLQVDRHHEKQRSETHVARKEQALFNDPPGFYPGKGIFLFF